MSAPLPEPQATARLGRSINQMGNWVGRVLLAKPQPPADGWALWHAACTGDAASAARLVQQLTPQAHGLAMQMLARREDAEDVVQEAFLRLWRSRPNDASGAALATYFNTIVINRCKTWLTRRHEWSTDPEQLGEWSDAQQQADQDLPSLDAALLRSAMARLPARQRMALAMWAYADADVADIARSLELDSNAAHQLLYRAKAALRNQLQERKP